MSAMSQSDFARDIGVARSRVTALKQAGRLVLDDKGRVMVEESKARIAETADPNRDDVVARHAASRASAGGVSLSTPGGGAEDKIGSSYQAARAVKERYLALEAKRAYEVACGDLVRADEVAAAAADAAATIRTRLEALPDFLSAQMAGPLDEAQRRAVIAETIEHILAGLSADFRKLRGINETA